MLETSPTTATPKLSDLKVKIFADGADKAGIVELAKNAYVKGFTTNPTLMRKSGISDYATGKASAMPDRRCRRKSLR